MVTLLLKLEIEIKVFLKLIKKIVYKIKNKEFNKYIIWKLKEFVKNPIIEIKLNLFKYQLLNAEDNFEKYLELKFKILKNKKSDINEHLDTLKYYASQSESIFETGVRGVVSSWAFLLGLHRNKKKNKKIFLNDINVCDIEEISKIAKRLNIDLDFEWGNNLDLKINENFDIVFIDTWHVYAQLKRELQKFSLIANKYIILHDTTLDGEIGESLRHGWNIERQSLETGFLTSEIEKGLWPAVEEFLLKNNNWVLEKRYTNCNGLTILKKS